MAVPGGTGRRGGGRAEWTASIAENRRDTQLINAKQDTLSGRKSQVGLLIFAIWLSNETTASRSSGDPSQIARALSTIASLSRSDRERVQDRLVSSPRVMQICIILELKTLKFPDKIRLI